MALAFLHFDGTDGLIEEFGPDETADRLEALVTEVQRAADRHQVTFLATDVDRDGGKIILTAGVPATTGDDEHRMLLAVRDVMDAGCPYRSASVSTGGRCLLARWGRPTAGRSPSWATPSISPPG